MSIFNPFGGGSVWNYCPTENKATLSDAFDSAMFLILGVILLFISPISDIPMATFIVGVFLIIVNYSVLYSMDV